MRSSPSEVDAAVSDRRQRVLVLGGGGFIGSAVCDELLRRGYGVRVFERPRVAPYRTFNPNEPMEWTNGDLQSTADIREVLKTMDAVVHLVSTTLPKGSNEDTIFDVQTNVIGTLQVLNMMVELGIRRIVFISSGGTVYGLPKTLPIDENHPTDPLVSYGITKLVIEKYLALYSSVHGISSVVLRVANPYGPRQRVETAQGAIGVFVHKALNNQPVQIWGDGCVIRDYIHVSDVAAAFAAAVAYDGSRSLVLNVGSGRGERLLDLLTSIENCLHRTVAVEFLPSRNIDVPSNILDISRAREILGWAPTVSLNDGIAETIAWFRQQALQSPPVLFSATMGGK
jgi:UDP-glucose 4-epimerase